MKLMKKLLTAVFALVMMIGLSTRAFAEDGEPAESTVSGTITVKKNFKEQTYELYKIFDATATEGRTEESPDGISYKLMVGKTDFKATVNGKEVDGSKWFTIDDVGNVSLADGVSSITFDAEFAGWAKAYGTQIGESLTASKNDDETVKWENLTAGYYFITTTTGSLVTVDSITPSVEVEDKNTIPEVDKTITGASDISEDGKKALAQIGTEVEFKAEVTVGKGSKSLYFHDKMDAGLTFISGSVTVTGVGSDKYEILDPPVAGDTFTIKFADGLTEDTDIKITITYRAIINADAVTKVENHAKLTYGDNSTSTQESKTETYNAKVSVKKYDGAEINNKPLAGAGFKLKNSKGEYYHYDEKANVVSWVDEASGDEHVSDAHGDVAPFIGLAAGTYTLVESTVPSGYNKASDTTVTVNAGDYTEKNLRQEIEIENNTGTELPSTGGTGTTMFYVFGALLVIAAGVLLVSRKRMSE